MQICLMSLSLDEAKHRLGHSKPLHMLEEIQQKKHDSRVYMF